MLTSFMDKFYKRFPWYHYSYFIDLSTAVLFFVVVFAVTQATQPFHRYLPPNDPSVNYPFVPDIVPSKHLLFFVQLIPFSVGSSFYFNYNSGVVYCNVSSQQKKLSRFASRSSWLSDLYFNDNNCDCRYEAY